MKGLKKDRTEKEEKIRQPYTKTTAVVQVLMTMLAALFLAPLFIIVNYSFKTKKELYINSPLSLPQSFQLDNYVKAIDKLNMGTTYINTFIYTAVSVFVLAMLCGITAWAIARCKHRFFKFCYIYFIVGILIQHKIRHYFHVCGNGHFLWRIPHEQFYVHGSGGTGGSGQD